MFEHRCLCIPFPLTVSALFRDWSVLWLPVNLSNGCHRDKHKFSSKWNWQFNRQSSLNHFEQVLTCFSFFTTKENLVANAKGFYLLLCSKALKKRLLSALKIVNVKFTNVTKFKEAFYFINLKLIDNGTIAAQELHHF